MPTELDKRVQRLEEDMNILKNQIRNTLLDIQEQLAASYHPSLRAARGAARQGAAHPPAADEPPEADDETDDAPRPKVKKVSLKDLRPTAGDPAPSKTESPPAAGDTAIDTLAGHGDGLRLYAGLIAWANASVARVGAGHTRRILETYAADGHLAAQLAASIVQLAALGSDDAPAQEAPVEEMLGVLMSLNDVLGAADRAPKGVELPVPMPAELQRG